MDTIHISKVEMESRIARFETMATLPVQTEGRVPVAARDLVYARTIKPVIGLDHTTPVSANAPIRGAGGITMGVAICPPGQGPDLHAHRHTYETFTVLRGQFEIRWNLLGDESAVLGELDTISVPPGVCRAFRNVGQSMGIIQAVISGGESDMNDIDYTVGVAEKIRAIDPAALEALKEVGFTFEAGSAETP